MNFILVAAGQTQEVAMGDNILIAHAVSRREAANPEADFLATLDPTAQSLYNWERRCGFCGLVDQMVLLPRDDSCAVLLYGVSDRIPESVSMDASSDSLRLGITALLRFAVSIKKLDELVLAPFVRTKYTPKILHMIGVGIRVSKRFMQPRGQLKRIRLELPGDWTPEELVAVRRKLESIWETDIAA